MQSEHSFAEQAHFTDLNKLPLAVELGNFRAEFLYWGFFEPEYWRNYLHIHSFFEICYAYQGHGIFRIHDREERVEAGQIFIAKPGEPHEIISSIDDPLGIYFWSYTLLPAPNADAQDHVTARSHVTPLDQNQRDLNRLLQAFSESTGTISDQATTIAMTLDRLTIEVVHQRLGYLQQLQSLASSLLVETARAMLDDEIMGAPLPELTNDVADKIVRYLHDNYYRPLQVRDVAAQLHMSERHTSRIFKQTMGISIQKYLVQYRLSIAKQRLLDQTQTISTIAHELGYGDARHFSTLFRTHTGMTPTEFRDVNGTSFLE